MADSKYRQKYCKRVKEYFLKFIELRDDPDEADKAKKKGMVAVVIENGTPVVQNPPSTGYPTLTKFAIKIGVSPRTLRNWRKEHEDFDEACEWAEEIFRDVMEERALTGKIDGRVAMKILELRAAAKKDEKEELGNHIRIEIKNLTSPTLELKEQEGITSEDTGYTQDR